MDGETKKTEFPSAGGQKLAAALELPVGEPRGYALFAHCFTCSKDIKAAREIARALRTQGLAVLRFDFTGLGGSEGDFANTNFSSNVEDLVSAANFLRREFEAPSILIGHSLGGAAALVAAKQVPEIRGVAVIGAPANADHILSQIGEKRDEIERLGVATVDLAGRPFSIKSQFIDDLSSQNVLACAAALKVPLLVMHAPLDQTVGIDNATQIYVAAKHPKSFISLDTADHLLSNADDARYAADVLSAWASRYLETREDADATAAAPARAPAAVPDYHGGARAVGLMDAKLAVAMSVDGYPIIIDSGREDGGDGLGPNPTRIVEAGLAACAAITVRMYAKRKKWRLTGVEVIVKRGRSEDSHAPHLMEKSMRVEGDLSSEQRDKLLEIADKCPVHRLLTAGVTVNSQLIE